MLLFALLISFLVVTNILAQEQEQRTMTLTKESVEELLRVLSPACKIEMEQALGSQIEISGNCKEEIQSVVMSWQHSGNLKEPLPLEDDIFHDENSAKAKPASEAPSLNAEPFINPVIGIIAFVVSLFSGAAALVYFINNQRGTGPVNKPKKLSKKKEEKQRQKAANSNNQR